MNQESPIRALIVDDEPLGREVIREMLSGDPEVEVVAECASGPEAIEAVRCHDADLLFLDVQMPEMSGFQVLEALGPERAPLVIFVTAYDQYAVRAFEVYALDYVLKPFDHERLERALRRAKEQIRKERDSNLSQRIVALLEDVKSRPKYLERLVVKTGGRVFFLKTEEVDWIEAEDNYVRMHTGKESHLFRETIRGLEAQLDPGRFVRIHRSALVNIDRVKELQPWFHGEYRVILKDGTELTLSRRYKQRLEEVLGRPL
ncbi:MAG TPA: LytTR family DNA-binding domain-containing protein [Blastocatellia bacterium]|nr:LytTR family DNA-binding domain-containing protein [Blastocatellia bacterium]